MTNLKRISHQQASFDVVMLIHPEMDASLVNYYQLLLNKLTFNEGKKSAVSVLKKYYVIATKVAMHKPFIPVSFRKSDKLGFPNDLKPFEKLLRGHDLNGKQAALTILRQYVQIYLPPDENTDSITTIGVSSDRISWLDEWDSFITFWVTKFTFPCQSWRQGVLRRTTKSGPNGPALLWAHIDALALKSSQKLWNSFVNFNLLMKQEDLTNYVIALSDCKTDLPIKSYKHSKLSFLSQGGGKTRVVAIGDFWSQEALKGLHEFLHRCLGQLRTDGTYDQGRVARITREATKKGLPIFCFDLTAATDRFPAFMLVSMLSKLFSPEIANEWKALLADRPFTHKSNIVKYGSGTPMGLLTSWASFSLCHHALIEFAAFRSGFKHFEDYVVLGDDVAIFNERVASNYESLIFDLGVSISKDKTVISYGPDHNAAEIAKRLFYNGVEISPIPFDIIQKSKEDILIFPMLIRTMIDRGVKLDPVSAGTLLGKWYKNHFPYLPLLTIPVGCPGYISYPDSHLLEAECELQLKSATLTNRQLKIWKSFTIEIVKSEIIRQRIKLLSEKLGRMQAIYNQMAPGRINMRPSQSIGLFLHRRGIPIPNSVLHAPSALDTSGEITLPVMYVVSAELMETMFLEERLEDADPSIEGSLSLKEYVPDLTIQKYFNTFEEIKQKRTSSVMLDTLKKLQLAK